MNNGVYREVHHLHNQKVLLIKLVNAGEPEGRGTPAEEHPRLQDEALSGASVRVQSPAGVWGCHAAIRPDVS